MPFCYAFWSRTETHERTETHTTPADFENGKKVTDKPPLHTKTGHVLPADFENGRFENEALTDTFWQWHRVNTPGGGYLT